MARKRRARDLGWLFFALCSCLRVMNAQEATVALQVHVHSAKQHRSLETGRPNAAGSANVVVWLTPLAGQPAPAVTRSRETYQLAQKNKQFTPHLLVVPTGSSVDFPNLDPFFHNVFSLFNGKRFDLGLYEAGSRRAVRFDREGVSYIFCNIHPEMGAIVVSLSAPTYAVTADNGSAILHDVPRGVYRLHLWAEDVSPEQLQAAERQVKVDGSSIQVGNIDLEASAHTTMSHKNKFGEDYKAPPTDPY